MVVFDNKGERKVDTLTLVNPPAIFDTFYL